MSAFVDEAKIYVAAGNGGDGANSFRREANEPRGGPSGGDGGRGGSVIFVAEQGLSTLLDFKYRQHYKATHGEPGRNKDQYGAGGDDLVVRVPVGTLVTDEETGEVIADFLTAGQRAVICQGGEGGLGNIHFKTAWNQAPTKCTPGTTGVQRTIRLELKLLADVGLLGYPNVGKSTFISAVSRARPKIANYPFTTLTPKLGVVGLPGERSFVLADIPGLIERAAEGAGLGIRFLKHLDRTRVIIHLLEQTMEPDRSPLKDYDILRNELVQYDPELAHRPEIVALSKLDVTEAREALPELAKAFADRGIHLRAVSAATGEGMREILEVAWKTLQDLRNETASETAATVSSMAISSTDR